MSDLALPSPGALAPGGDRADSKRREGSLSWREQQIVKAQEDMYRLVAYATEQSRPVPKEIIREAVNIGRVDAARMSEDQEETLWHTRATLSGMVLPAHAAGLRMMGLLEDASSTREPRKLKSWIGSRLLLFTLLVAGVHTYAEVGGMLIAESRRQLALAPRLGPQAQPPPTATPGVPALPVLPTPTPAEMEEAIGESWRTLEDMHGRLHAWNGVWRFPGAWLLPAPPGVMPPSSVGADSRPARSAIRRLTYDVALPLRAEIHAADVAQSTVTSYVLPILYGALGAFVFVMRSVGRDIDSGSLRTLLHLRILSRLLLGAVFGLSLAMLATEQSPLLKEVPIGAMALAFLAGYAIDAAFGLLDALIDRIRNLVPKAPASDPGGAARGTTGV